MFLSLRQSRPKVVSSTLAAVVALGMPLTTLGAIQTVTPQEMIESALENNFELEIQRMEIAINEDREVVARGDLATVFRFSANHDSEERTQNQLDFLSTGGIRLYDEENTFGELAVSKRFQTGTVVELSSALQRLENSVNREPDAPFSPEYESVSEISLTQPILRGFGDGATLAALRVQEFTTEAVRLEALGVFENILGQVLISTFEASFGLENIRVKEESVELAERLMKANQRRLEEGLMTPVDVTLAEVRLAEAKEELIAAKTFYRERVLRLRELTGQEYDLEPGAIVYEGVDDLTGSPDLDRESLRIRVLESNPNYRATLERIEAAGIRLQFAQNQALPQIDLQASLGYNGLSGSVGEAFEDYETRNGPNWGVGVTASVSLDREIERARVSEARRARTQSIFESKRIESRLLSALDTAIQKCVDLSDRMVLAEESVRAAEETVRGEEKRLASGVTTTFDVLNQQRELSVAQSRALAVAVEYEKALVDLLILQGRLVETLGIELELSGLEESQG